MDFLKKLFKSGPKLPMTDLDRRFDLIARIGQGSMSKVWRTQDSMTGKSVALKVLDKQKTERLYARFPGLNKPSEGKIAVQLQHPHIVRTFEHGISRKKEEFLVMDFIEGLGLSYLVEVQNDVMQENRLRFMIQLGNALAYIHKQNLIHRDICPRNVLVDSEHQIKLIDFGLAVPNTPDFRKPGNRTGTASYMAPELIKRQPTDQRIDIFSFAVTCFEMFTKRFPWDGGETIEMVMQHINSPPNDIRQFDPEIDEQIALAIMKGLQRDPNDRWQTVDEMVSELRDARRRLENVRDEDENFKE
jgi:serine/threonine protein kinase